MAKVYFFPIVLGLDEFFEKLQGHYLSSCDENPSETDDLATLFGKRKNLHRPNQISSDCFHTVCDKTLNYLSN